MKAKPAISTLFLAAAVYDGILGMAFLSVPASIFEWFNVTPPNHRGYIEFPALLLLSFAVMYVAIARNPVANRNLIPYGMLLKVSYCAVVFYHWVRGGIPNLWKPWAFADLVFLVLFYAAWRRLAAEAESTAS
ncbi:MAG TPA: hypothetical protein VLE22_05070 [Bryobacteraceae bacterium]|nr:hypothetical protein [Bryobacteraceae bacterium]